MSDEILRRLDELVASQDKLAASQEALRNDVLVGFDEAKNQRDKIYSDLLKAIGDTETTLLEALTEMHEEHKGFRVRIKALEKAS